MNTNEKYIARIMFQLKVHKSDGQLYENLFSKIMTKHNPNFRMIKPYGNIGDRKNDGFDKKSGIYYQVYAPEDVEKTKTITVAISKLREDFKGLKKHWDAICKIKEFYYVVNDKYKGLPPQVEQEILLLGSEHTNVVCDSFCSHNLETIFMGLSTDDIIDIVGIIPTEEISFLDFDVLNKSVEYIMNSEVDVSQDTYVENPDFEYKIKFNKLSPKVANLLTVASYQIGDLEAYFAATGEYVKSELKSRFSKLYDESKKEINESDQSFPDKRFFYILDNAAPNGKKAVKDATLVLMSFYFEACDIFEKPKNTFEVK